MTRIIVTSFGLNIGSQRALEKADFTHKAVFGEKVLKDGEVEDGSINAERR